MKAISDVASCAGRCYAYQEAINSVPVDGHECAYSLCPGSLRVVPYTYSGFLLAVTGEQPGMRFLHLHLQPYLL
jgi:hypothetical protein